MPCHILVLNANKQRTINGWWQVEWWSIDSRLENNTFMDNWEHCYGNTFLAHSINQKLSSRKQKGKKTFSFIIEMEVVETTPAVWPLLILWLLWETISPRSVIIIGQAGLESVPEHIHPHYLIIPPSLSSVIFTLEWTSSLTTALWRI